MNEDQSRINEILMRGRYVLVGVGGADGSVLEPMFVNVAPGEAIGALRALLSALEGDAAAGEIPVREVGA